MSNLSGKYAIVGVGETPYVRGAGRSTRALGVEAVRNAMLDAGLDRSGIDGMLSYHSNDSTGALTVASDLGIRLNVSVDVTGGGSSTEALIAIAIGLMEAGLCHTVVCFRAMLGYSGMRFGGTGRAAQPVSGNALFTRPYGVSTPAQMFSTTFVRHMYEYGTTSAQAAHVKTTQSKHASNNPKALMKKRVTVDDVLSSRWICKPIHLLDACLETDNAAALVITSHERARDLRHTPIRVLGVAGRTTKPRGDFYWEHGPITRVAGYYVKDIVFGMAGVTPEDIDITGAYDCFTWAAMLQLEEYGFCEKGEGGDYVSSGAIELGGRRPNNLSGGQLCEGYTHGLSLVIENVRQLRGQADDYCSDARNGAHTFDYSEGHCRQVKDPALTMNMGWGTPAMGSAVILTNR